MPDLFVKQLDQLHGVHVACLAMKNEGLIQNKTNNEHKQKQVFIVSANAVKHSTGGFRAYLKRRRLITHGLVLIRPLFLDFFVQCFSVVHRCG